MLRQVEVGGYNLLVMGGSPRPGGQLSLGRVSAELLERAECSVLFVASEPSVSVPEPRNSPAGEQQPVRGSSIAATGAKNSRTSTAPSTIEQIWVSVFGLRQTAPGNNSIPPIYLRSPSQTLP